MGQWQSERNVLEAQLTKQKPASSAGNLPFRIYFLLPLVFRIGRGFCFVGWASNTFLSYCHCPIIFLPLAFCFFNSENQFLLKIPSWYSNIRTLHLSWAHVESCGLHVSLHHTYQKACKVHTPPRTHAHPTTYSNLNYILNSLIVI